MKKWMIYSIALALTCALWGGQDTQAAGPVFVDENADGIDDNVRISYHRGRKGVFGRHGTSSQLTKEQRAELKTLVDGLKESDTSREDIRAAVDAKLEEWGVERPDRSRGGKRGHGRRGGHRVRGHKPPSESTSSG